MNSKSGYLYRVMSLEQFIDMMFDGAHAKPFTMSNKIVRPWMWDDPYEKILSLKSTLFHSERWFGQCWSMSEENDSIWRNLSQNGNNRCVKIKVSINNLKKSLLSYNKDSAQFILAPVNYFSKETIDEFTSTSESLAKLAKTDKRYERMQLDSELIILLTKRPAFRPENEVRLLVYDKTETLETNIWKYPFDINSYVEEVMFDPWTKDYYQDDYKELLGRMGLENVGKVTFSQLYKPLDENELRSSQIKENKTNNI